MRRTISAVRRWALDVQSSVSGVVMKGGILCLSVVSGAVSIPFRVLAQAMDLGLYIMDEFEYWSQP